MASPKALRNKEFIMRHKLALQDSILILISVLVAAYTLLQVQVFTPPGSVLAPNTIEASEVPLLGIVLCVGMLFFSWRRMRALKREIAARTKAQEALREMAFQDALTALPNRRSLLNKLSTVVRSPPSAGATHAVLLLDLNGFKRINDVFGHAAGDEALIIIAQRLLAAMRDDDLVARLGGDEFAFVATQMPNSEKAAGLALRLLQSIEKPLMVGGAEHSLSAGIGVCLLPFEGCTPDEALRRADLALYKAKGMKKGTIRFFDDAMDNQIHERDRMEREFRRAIATHSIKPYFQPLVSLQTNKIIGFEALARWHHESFGDVPPERFIAIAEDLGLIGELTDQLLREACDAAVKWPEAITLAFNLSPAELHNERRAHTILEILAETGLKPSRLEIEITESAMVRDLELARTVLGALRSAGVRIALDDFGTGYSSLYHLRNFKVDSIKIDRSFIHTMREKECAEIVAAMIGLGTGLGLAVTAEGIEQPLEEEALVALGCKQGQGFLFSQAVLAETTLSMLNEEAIREMCASS